jgi:hypothetical protein
MSSAPVDNSTTTSATTGGGGGAAAGGDLATAGSQRTFQCAAGDHCMALPDPGWFHEGETSTHKCFVCLHTIHSALLCGTRLNEFLADDGHNFKIYRRLLPAESLAKVDTVDHGSLTLCGSCEEKLKQDGKDFEDQNDGAEPCVTASVDTTAVLSVDEALKGVDCTLPWEDIVVSASESNPINNKKTNAKRTRLVGLRVGVYTAKEINLDMLRTVGGKYKIKGSGSKNKKAMADAIVEYRASKEQQRANERHRR